MKKILLLLFTLLLITGCEKEDAEKNSNKGVQSISFDKKEITLNTGETYKFKVNRIPADSDEPEYDWLIYDIKYSYLGDYIGGYGAKMNKEDGTITSGKGCTLYLEVSTYNIAKDEYFCDTCKVTFLPSKEDVYGLFCYGFPVKDTSGFYSGENINFEPQASKSDTTYLVGFRGDHIWIGTYRTSTKEQIEEWTDTEETSKIQKIYAGYGNYKEFPVKQAKVLTFIKNGDDILLNLIIDNESSLDTKKHCVLYFRKNGKVKRYFFKNSSESLPIKWYNDTYLFYIDVREEPYKQNTRYYTCFSDDGNVITSGKLSEFYSKDWYPTSYDEFLRFYSNSTYMYVEKNSISKERTVWDKVLIPNIKSDDLMNISLLTQNGDIWTFRIDITEYSGNKYSKTFDININDGSFTKHE